MKITHSDSTGMRTPDKEVRGAQRLRLQRFVMALTTYGVVTLATALTTKLGLGKLSVTQWLTLIGLALYGNTVFFVLLSSGLNLRFKDPSLTREQILYSAFWGMVILYGLPNARPIVLLFYVPAFSFGMLRLSRRQYLSVAVCVMVMYAIVLIIEYSQNRPGFNIEYELFIYIIFSILMSWFAFFGGFVSNIRNRLKMKNIIIQKAHDDLKVEMEGRRQAQIEKDKLIVELQKTLAEVKTLTGLLPICAQCKKIRDDKGYWNQLETYISNHSKAIFSHGLCPACAKNLYPEVNKNKDKK
jgi:hypothetical protein